MTNLELSGKAQQMLIKREVSYNDFWFEGDDVHIIIEGDWKHDHLHCDYIMESFGYQLFTMCEIGESDSDWYTAERVYRRA